MSREVKKKKDPEIETADMFAVCNRLREVEKCCANCKFVKHEWEGEVSCMHPTLTYVDEYGDPWKAGLGSKGQEQIVGICDELYI